MKYKGLQCTVQPFNVAGAEIPASLDTSYISHKFQSVLEKQLSRKGLSLGQDSPEDKVIINGRFVRIEQGSMLLRQILPLTGAGKTVMEVEGELILGGRQMAQLHAIAEQSGFRIGTNKDMLEFCAKSCALRITKQIISTLKSL